MDETKRRIDRLDREIRDIANRLNRREQIQLQVPIDAITQNLLDRDRLIYRNYTAGATAASATSASGYLTVNINGQEYNVLIK